MQLISEVWQYKTQFTDAYLYVIRLQWVSLLCAKLFWYEVNLYLHFLILPLIDWSQVLEILIFCQYDANFSPNTYIRYQHFFNRCHLCFQNCPTDVSVAGLAVLVIIHLPPDRGRAQDHGHGDVAVPYVASPRHEVWVRRLESVDWYAGYPTFQGDYRKVSNIRRTKFQNLNDSHLVLKSSLPNPLKPGVKSRMKM